MTTETKPTPAPPVGALGSMLSRFITPKPNPAPDLTAANFPPAPTTIQ